jgi:hypothetical protein
MQVAACLLLLLLLLSSLDRIACTDRSTQPRMDGLLLLLSVPVQLAAAWLRKPQVNPAGHVCACL